MQQGHTLRCWNVGGFTGTVVFGPKFSLKHGVTLKSNAILMPLKMTGVVTTALVLAGCASGPRPVLPTEVTYAVSVTAKANPDVRGRPSPVVIRIYELKSAATFDSADYFSLTEKEQSSLGAELIHREEMIIQPGQSSELKRKVSSDTKTVAVIASFRDLERSVWRQKKNLPPPLEAGRFFGSKGANQRITITVDERTVTIQ
jgi:type VI secretion system protein VasD